MTYTTMPSFKEFLVCEANSIFAPWHEKDPVKIQQIVSKSELLSNRVTFSVLKNASVKFDAYNSMPLYWTRAEAEASGLPADRLPFAIANFNFEIFSIKGEELTSIWGAPAKGDCLTLDLPKITSLEHLNGQYNSLRLNCKNLNALDCNIQIKKLVIFQIGDLDLSSIAKSIKSDGLTINVLPEARHAFFRKPLLSLLTIKNFSSISQVIKKHSVESFELNKAFAIISRNKNLYECQEELMDNDLHDYATF